MTVLVLNKGSKNKWSERGSDESFSICVFFPPKMASRSDHIVTVFLNSSTTDLTVPRSVTMETDRLLSITATCQHKHSDSPKNSPFPSWRSDRRQFIGTSVGGEFGILWSLSTT